ncbi:hypothetical protein [Micromonospora sp. NBC_00860]|uniref:hypothetical protein n=1 Tax=Micromonospora sp. NBC_00860 TaxID=2975980 RepID=UPI0038659E28|nr:hypothetical protein OH804_04505 [Micromonospora sp. NBC_00860]
MRLVSVNGSGHGVYVYGDTVAAAYRRAGLRSPVTHRQVTIVEAVAGTSGFERDLAVLTFERVRAGRFAEVAETVGRVSGRPARTLRAFLADTGSLTASR